MGQGKNTHCNSLMTQLMAHNDYGCLKLSVSDEVPALQQTRCSLVSWCDTHLSRPNLFSVFTLNHKQGMTQSST